MTKISGISTSDTAPVGTHLMEGEKVDGTSVQMQMSNLFKALYSGTRDGTKFARDDGTYAFLGATLNIPDGTMINGKISPTVVSSDLVLTLLTADGSDPSASNPVYVKIGGTIRACTAPLSVTKADATNWANLGSTALATFQQELFPYLTWNTALGTPAVDIFWSRVPYGTLYSDFSGTSTNELYAAVNATPPNATDVCVNVGRFAATLSGTAGFVWTVPSYTASNLIQRPIYETNWLTYDPFGGATLTNFSANPTGLVQRYRVVGKEVQVRERELTNGTSSGTGNATLIAPFTAQTVTNGSWHALGAVVDNSAAATLPGLAAISTGGATITMFKDAAATAAGWTAAGGRRFGYFELRYPIVA